jgi:8-oxo-dGTP diphosphatase
LTIVPSVVPPSWPQLAVSGAIFRDNRILLVRRARSPAKGLYSLPGGRVEFGESLHAALHREVAEETALTIKIIELAGWREALPGAAGGGHYLIMSFARRRARSERRTRRLLLARARRTERPPDNRGPAWDRAVRPTAGWPPRLRSGVARDIVAGQPAIACF